jgi:very-short-patch-repair endonuclease
VNYPVIKIPSLIENARPQEIITIQEKDIYIKTPNKHGLFLLKTIKKLGYALLFLGTLICCFTLTGNFQWLPLGVILSLLGLIAANWRYIQPELLNPEQIQSTKKISQIQLLPIDWENILANKTIDYRTEAKAQKGVSETYFHKYLQQYFPQILHPSYEFKINNDYTYSSDFTIILPNKISLVIEIDEPYEGKSKTPHHCTDDYRDNQRDNFFIAGNWIVMRFSEFQACAYPVECCFEIAKIIDRFTSDNYSKHFKNTSNVPKDPQWNKKRSALMAKNNYRQEYLSKYGIYRN